MVDVEPLQEAFEVRMKLWEILLIAVSLAMDATAVCLGVGATEHASAFRPRFRMAFHFGLFQFLMPVLGWFAGISVARFIASLDHWIAFGLLGFVGGHMLVEAFDSTQTRYSRDPSRGRTLVMLSVATSLDTMAVGVSLGVARVAIWYPAAVIGIITCLMSLAGGTLGKRLGEAFGKRMEIVGGVILILIGGNILVTHLMGRG